MASFWERQARRAKNAGLNYTPVGVVGSALLGHKTDTGDFINNKFLGGDQKRAAKKAAQIGVDAEAENRGLIKGIYDQSRSDNAPFLKIGTDAATSLSGMLKGGSFENPAFPTYNGSAAPEAFSYGAFDPSAIKNEPGYQFGLDQGLQSVQNSAAAGRGLHSGNTLTGITKYAEDYAGTKLNDAFSRYTTGRNQALGEYNTRLGQFNSDRNFNYGQNVDKYNAGVNNQAARFSRLAQLAGYGPAAANQNSNLGQNFGQSYGNSLTNGASAQANGLVAGANAQTAGIDNLLKLFSSGAGALAGRA